MPKRNPAPGAAAILASIMLLAPYAAGTPVQDSRAKTEEPVTWSTTLDKSPASPGTELNLEITASIKEGWHLYSTEQRKGGPRPTAITLPAGQPFEISGDIDADIPLTALDENFGVKADYYEGSATFTVPIKLAASATPGRQTLHVEVRYQSCSKELCMPPTTIKLEVPVDIKAAK